MNLFVPGHGASGRELLFANFKQDNSCFACGTVNGFVVFNTVPSGRLSGEFSVVVALALWRCYFAAIYWH